MRIDDGDGHTDEATVEILTAVPTPTEEPGFEAVFANFSFQKETFMTQGDTHGHENNKVFSYQKFIKENIVSSFGKAFLSKKRFAVAYLVLRRRK